MPFGKRRFFRKKKKELVPRVIIDPSEVKTALIRAISIDVGLKNLAIYVEEFDRKKLQKLSSKIDARSVQADPEILRKIFKNGRRLFHDKVDVSDGSKNLTTKAMVNINRYLDAHREIFDPCLCLCIEDQLKENPTARRIEQHILTWFSINYLDTKVLIPFPPTRKTMVLGAPKKIKGQTAYQRKKVIKDWAIEQAEEIFKLRKDERSLINLYSYRKKDDLSDTVCQLQAFKYQVFVKGVI